MISVNGVLRTMLTYAVPIQLSIGTGESRIAASSVPRMSAPTAEYTVNWMVVQNASKIWVWYLLNSSTSVADRLLVDGRRRRRGDTRGPRFLSNATFQDPSCTILVIASLIFVRRSVSPFFRPMP